MVKKTGAGKCPKKKSHHPNLGDIIGIFHLQQILGVVMLKKTPKTNIYQTLLKLLNMDVHLTT